MQLIAEVLPVLGPPTIDVGEDVGGDEEYEASLWGRANALALGWNRVHGP